MQRVATYILDKACLGDRSFDKQMRLLGSCTDWSRKEGMIYHKPNFHGTDHNSPSSQISLYNLEC